MNYTELLTDIERVINPLTVYANSNELTARHALTEAEKIRAKIIEAIATAPAVITKTTIKAAALRILKSADASRPVLQKAHARGEFVDVCDGFRGIRFYKESAPELPTNDPREPFPVLDTIYNDARGNTKPANLPALNDLILYIKTEKAKKRAVKDKTPVFYEFDHGQTVNAEYLRDVLQALPNATARAHSSRDYAPLYFEAVNGCGVLMPIRIQR